MFRALVLVLSSTSGPLALYSHTKESETSCRDSRLVATGGSEYVKRGVWWVEACLEIFAAIPSREAGKLARWKGGERLVQREGGE